MVATDTIFEKLLWMFVALCGLARPLLDHWSIMDKAVVAPYDMGHLGLENKNMDSRSFTDKAINLRRTVWIFNVQEKETTLEDDDSDENDIHDRRNDRSSQEEDELPISSPTLITFSEEALRAFSSPARYLRQVFEFDDVNEISLDMKFLALGVRIAQLEEDLRNALREIPTSRSPVTDKQKIITLQKSLDNLRRSMMEMSKEVSIKDIYKQMVGKPSLRRSKSWPELLDKMEVEDVIHSSMFQSKSQNRSIGFNSAEKIISHVSREISHIQEWLRNFQRTRQNMNYGSSTEEDFDGNREDDSDDDDLYGYSSPHGSSQQFPGISERIRQFNNRPQENEGSRPAVPPSTVNNRPVVPASHGNIEDDSDDDGSSQQFPGISERIRQFNNRPQAEDQSHSNAPSTVDQNRFLKHRMSKNQ